MVDHGVAGAGSRLIPGKGPVDPVAAANVVHPLLESHLSLSDGNDLQNRRIRQLIAGPGIAAMGKGYGLLGGDING